jgi:hypothetical protein
MSHCNSLFRQVVVARMCDDITLPDNPLSMLRRNKYKDLIRQRREVAVRGLATALQREEKPPHRMKATRFLRAEGGAWLFQVASSGQKITYVR